MLDIDNYPDDLNSMQDLHTNYERKTSKIPKVFAPLPIGRQLLHSVKEALKQAMSQPAARS